MKILIMTDSLFIPSGLARVGRELAFGFMANGHQVGYIGWFQRPDIPTKVPENMFFWSTNNNLYGADILDGVINAFRPDILLTIGDLWWIAYIADSNQCRTRRTFQWCSYISVDGEPIGGGLPPNLIPIVNDIDIPVAYTDYSKTAILKSISDIEVRMRLQVIYHGVNPEVFKPLPWLERKKIRDQFGVGDKFMFLTVCRNQSRKNIPEMFRAWKEFSETEDAKGNVVYWPHMYFKDPMGWPLDEFFDVIKLRNQSIMYYQQIAFGISEMHLIPDLELAKLYQIADAFILISGEGFGLPIFEAMATRLPCILLDYASGSELGADGRAEMVPAGSCEVTGMRLTQRPMPRIDDIVSSMTKVFKNRSYRESIAIKGYDFATQYSWKRITSEWNHLMIRQEVPFIQPVEMEVCS